MEKENATLLTEFVLTGLTHHSEWKILLFLVFLVIYLITIVGKLGLIVPIWNDPHLQIPMYFFLGILAFVDAWISSTVTSKMVVNFSAKCQVISVSECKIQLFLFAFSGTTECILLAAMAYDCYVAICKPLLYSVTMNNVLCIRFSVLSFVGGFLHALIHDVLICRLTFYNSNIIHHFCCDIIPWFIISCTDPSINYLMIFVFSGSSIHHCDSSCLLYICPLYNLKKKSVKGIKKGFFTCGAHLLSVSLFYGPLLFMYVCPASAETEDQDMIDCLFYTVIIPLLNPIIYSLRNKQVIDSLSKMLKRNT